LFTLNCLCVSSTAVHIVRRRLKHYEASQSKDTFDKSKFFSTLLSSDTHQTLQHPHDIHNSTSKISAIPNIPSVPVILRTSSSSTNMSLPTKAQYLATLQPAVPAQDDLQCRIYRQDYNHPEEEVVSAGPECFIHPFHKACLIPWVDLADQNNCLAYRHQLYEQRPGHYSESYDGESEDDYYEYGYRSNEPDFRDTNDETGSWQYFHTTYDHVLYSLCPTIRGTELVLERWPADCLSVESHAVIARLCASMPQYPTCAMN
jgi:hypothetical protein